MILLGIIAFLVLFWMLKRVEDKMSEINDALAAFRDEVVPQLDAAVADIQKLHELLTGTPDVPAALAIIEELRGKFATLKTAVDIPEPGDEVPPPVEG